MNRIFIIAAALTGFSLTAPAAQAGNACASLPACYNHVINACNGTNHPENCAEAGMNACDEYHGAKNQSSAGQPLNIRMVSAANGKYRAILEKGAPARASVQLKATRVTR